MLTETTDVVERIYKYHESLDAAKQPRLGRLGASIIGHECDRFLWYSFRQLFHKKFDGRMLRLFETGHLEEPRFAAELKGIGCGIVDTVDPQTGEQIMVNAHGGHFVCYLDAMILGLPGAEKTWHVGEFKTMGGEEDQKKDFEKVSKNGVKAAKSEHYAQMMAAMGLSKITRALYLAKKKATDELYAERIKFVEEEYQNILDRAERVIKSAEPLERCSEKPDYYKCKWCDAAKLCWGTEGVPLPRVTCRSCCHATPELDGECRWSCAKHGRDLSVADQTAACADHLLLPGLVNFADPVDSGDDWIKFKNRDGGDTWKHGKEYWTTQQLIGEPR